MSENNQYKVSYSFEHVNQHPYLADGYKVYRQDGASAEYVLIKELNANQISENEQPVLVTGVDYVSDCGTVYNYRVSAYNTRGEIECINPLFSGINFVCPTPSPSMTPSQTPTPSKTPSITPSKTATPSATPSISVSKSPEATPSKTPSKTPSITPSKTPSITPSKTPSQSITPSKTPSITPSKTPGASTSPTPSKTPSISISPSKTPSQSVTPSKTPSITPSKTPSKTPSITPSKTPSISISPSKTPSITPSKTPSKTPSITPSKTPSITPSKTPPGEQITDFTFRISHDGSSSLSNSTIRDNQLTVTDTSDVEDSTLLEWPDGAVSFEITAVSANTTDGSNNATMDGSKLDGTSIQNAAPSSENDLLTNGGFGGFPVSYAVVFGNFSATLQWANSSNSEIPDKFWGLSVDVGLYDFGLVQCTVNQGSQDCTTRTTTITKNTESSVDNRIAFHIRLAETTDSTISPAAPGTRPFKIEIQGKWNY